MTASNNTTVDEKISSNTGAGPLSESVALHERLLAYSPEWVVKGKFSWGEKIRVSEWEDQRYRELNGWKGRDYVHSEISPVRILEYFVQYDTGSEKMISEEQEGIKLSKGGVGTILTGIAHFTTLAESHKGYCHGGSMCSVMDDVIGWCGFCASGKCLPWSGFTVQVNTKLRKPVPVNSLLKVQCRIVKMERRKVFLEATLTYPCDQLEEEVIHAQADGVVVLNRGILPGTE